MLHTAKWEYDLDMIVLVNQWGHMTFPNALIQNVWLSHAYCIVTPALSAVMYTAQGVSRQHMIWVLKVLSVAFVTKI